MQTLLCTSHGREDWYPEEARQIRDVSTTPGIVMDYLDYMVLRAIIAICVVSAIVAHVAKCDQLNRDLTAALERELRLRKVLDNVRVKYGNEAVEDDE